MKSYNDKHIILQSKNQLITISNLRLALEDLKRNESSSVSYTKPGKSKHSRLSAKKLSNDLHDV